MLRPRSWVPALVLAGVVAGAMGLWWLFLSPAPPAAPRPPPIDDLQMFALVTDGATGAAPSDVLLAATGQTILARASDRTVVAFGAGAPRTIARLGAPAWAMAPAGDMLWITAGDAIVRVPVAGGVPATVPCAVAHPRAIAADARAAYVVDAGPPQAGLTRASTIARVDAATGATRVLGRSAGDVTNVVADADHVYWADRLEGTIAAAPKDGGDARTLASDRGLPGPVAISGGTLTWVEKRDESIWSMPVTGGPPKRLVQDFAGFANLAADARGVFWTNEAAVDGAFHVFTVAPAGGDATPVSPAAAAIDAIATDGTTVYWDRGGSVTAL